MKKFTNKFIIIILFFVFETFGCNDHLQIDALELKRDATEKTNLEFALASVIKNAAIKYQDLSYDDLLLPCTVMHYQTLSGETQNTYLDFYHVRSDWDNFYRQLKLVLASVKLSQEQENKAYEGIFLIFKSLLFGMATDLYGPAIYTEALQAREGIIYPKYDKEEVIYQGILDDLKRANQLIKESAKSISVQGDILYGGDLWKWRKFSNSLRIRYLMRLSDKAPDWAKVGIAEILGNSSEYPIFETVDDNAGLSYPGLTSDNSWPGGPLNMGNNDFQNRKPTRMFVDSLVKYDDPRIWVWLAPAVMPWTTDPSKDGLIETVSQYGYDYEITWEYLPDDFDPEYKKYIVNTDSYWTGIFSGTTSTSQLRHDNGHYDLNSNDNYKISSYSKIFHENTNNLLKATIMNSDEVYFILAEAVEKGIISGNAESYYQKAVELSLKRWAITDETVINDFQSRVALSGNTQRKLIQIATQKWLAMLFISTETYLDIRRTGLPDFSGIVTSREIPVRFRYPTSESGQNTENYKEAVSWLSPGEDNEHSKVWLLQ